MVELVDYSDYLSPRQEAYVREWGDQPVDILLSQLALLNPGNTKGRGIYENPEDVVIPAEQVLLMLDLYDDEPDGQHLLERLTGGNGLLDLRRNHNGVYGKVAMLVDKANSAIAYYAIRGFGKPHCEEVLRTFALVISRQLTRESSLCPMALGYARVLADLRPQYLSEDAHHKLELAEAYGVDHITLGDR